MGDMGEIFNAMKADAKERRRARLEKAVEEKEIFTDLNVTIKEHSEHHWGFYHGKTKIGDYWPSNKRWLDKGGRTKFLWPKNLRDRLEVLYGKKNKVGG